MTAKLPTSIEIRKFKKEDAAVVKRIINEVMHSRYADVLGAFPSDDLENISNYYSKAGEAFFVAVSGEQILGSIGVKREDDRTALVRRIFVVPDVRKRNVGRSLLQTAIEFCREVGYSEVVFKTTSKMDDAIKLFEKNGFHEKAHLKLGPVDLYKLTYFIKENSPFSR